MAPPLLILFPTLSSSALGHTAPAPLVLSHSPCDLSRIAPALLVLSLLPCNRSQSAPALGIALLFSSGHYPSASATGRGSSVIGPFCLKWPSVAARNSNPPSLKSLSGALPELGCEGAGAVLCCAVLCCAVLCCAVLCCAVLCCAVLCCAVLCCAVLCCAVLCCALVLAQGLGECAGMGLGWGVYRHEHQLEMCRHGLGAPGPITGRATAEGIRLTGAPRGASAAELSPWRVSSPTPLSQLSRTGGPSSPSLPPPLLGGPSSGTRGRYTAGARSRAPLSTESVSSHLSPSALGAWEERRPLG